MARAVGVQVPSTAPIIFKKGCEKMQVNKENISNVITKFSVKVPSSDINKEIDSWLERRSKDVKIDGFRKGHAPIEKVRQNFLDKATYSSIESIVQKTVSNILKENNLKPITTPTYSIDSYDDNKDLEFSIFVEEQPKLEIDDLKKIKIEKVKCEVSDSEIEEEFKRFSKDYVKPSPVKNPAQNGGFAKVNIEVFSGGKLIEEFSIKNYLLKLDDADNEIVFAVVKNCIGKKAGDKFDCKVTLPKKLNDKKYSGKKLNINVDVIEVLELQSADFTEEEAKTLGFENIDKFKEFLKQTLIERRNNSINIYHKRLAMDSLSDFYKFDVPKSLVDKDFNRIWEYIYPEIKQAKDSGDKEFEGKTIEDIAKEYYEVSNRRVRLGFVIDAIAAKFDIKVSDDQIKEAVLDEMKKAPGREKEILQYFGNYSNAQHLATEILENLVINKVLEDATTSEKSIKKVELDKLLDDVLPD